MSANSSIEWTDSTFNPWIGCTKVSPGCDHCYAERDMDIRRHRVKWGAGNPRSRTSAAYWKQPLQWNARGFWRCDSCGWRGENPITDRCPRCDESGALVSARRRVFCASLADVFDNEVPVSWRVDLFNLIRSTPNLDWLLLTKRVGNATAMIDEAGGWSGALGGGGVRNPLPNVWIGATIVNQAEADRDIPKLLAAPAAVRFLSMEPLLGAVSLRWLAAFNGKALRGTESTNELDGLRQLDWIIAGGESGPHSRPMRPEWARSLRDQCAAAGVPFLFKQWGEFNEAGERRGKKLSGRELEGQTLTAFPR